jgi:hypothetical protein
MHTMLEQILIMGSKIIIIYQLIACPVLTTNKATISVQQTENSAPRMKESSYCNITFSFFRNTQTYKGKVNIKYTNPKTTTCLVVFTYL